VARNGRRHSRSDLQYVLVLFLSGQQEATMIEHGKLTESTASKTKKLNYIQSEIDRLKKQISIQQREMATLIAHDLDCSGSGALIRRLNAKLDQHEAMLISLVDSGDSQEQIGSDEIIQTQRDGESHVTDCH
jgi:polyphosphate kinase 2 (PPK2 family)